MFRCTFTSILILAALTLTACADQISLPTAASQEAAVLPSPSAVPEASQMVAAGAVPSAISAVPTREPTSATAASRPTATPTAAASPSRRPTATATATALPPAAPPTSEGPAVLVQTDANLRGGPGTAYSVIDAAQAGDRLPVRGHAQGWWQTGLGNRVAWISGALVTANAAAGQAPEVTDFPPPPTVEAKAVVQSGLTSTLPSTSSLPDLVVLGPETQYPVRARVIRGWGYEFVDASAAYDIVVRRDVFGMLAHQIDDENVQRYRRQSRFERFGPLRITLVDAQPHPNPGCPGWGWAPDRDTFVDPYGMTQDPCRVEHSLFPQGDGAGTILLIGWGYDAGTTVAVGAAGPRRADTSTTFLAETLPWPANLGPADRPDFTQPPYRPLGTAHHEDGRWVWQDAFAEVVPIGQ